MTAGLVTVLPEETGFDFSTSKPPPEAILRNGGTFIVGYVSPNEFAAKNLLNPFDYINAGIKVGYVWEATATQSNKGYTQGWVDGAEARRQVRNRLGPVSDPLAIIAANDTNTTAVNVRAQMEYMQGFHETCGAMGEYDDTDLAQATAGLWSIGWLPSAWGWSAPSRAQAEAKALLLGFHVFQHNSFSLEGKWRVDPNVCVNQFQLWGIRAENPVEDDVATMIFTVTGLPGEYMWTPGSDPIPFATPEDRDACRAGLGVGATQNLSPDQYERLFVPPVTVTIPPIVIPPITVPPYPTKITSTIS